MCGRLTLARSQACTRNGAAALAVDAFARGTKLGLAHSNAAHRVLIAAAAQAGVRSNLSPFPPSLLTPAQGADATVDAYNKLRATGALTVCPELVRLVMRGLQTPPSGSPRRALDAAAAFAAEGVQPGRRAWHSLLCACASYPDVGALSDTLATMRAAGEQPNAITHLTRSLASLLEGDGPSAEASMREAAALAPSLMRQEAQKDRAALALSNIVASWAQALPAGTAVPGGVEGLKARLEKALQAAGGVIQLDVTAAFKDAQLLDGPLAQPAAVAPPPAAVA